MEAVGFLPAMPTQPVLIILPFQAWKEGNHTVADFMASKITGVFRSKRNAEMALTCMYHNRR